MDCGRVGLYTWAGLSAEGNRFVEAETEERFRQWMGEWEEEMVRYLRTGRELNLPPTGFLEVSATRLHACRRVP